MWNISIQVDHRLWAMFSPLCPRVDLWKSGNASDNWEFWVPGTICKPCKIAGLAHDGPRHTQPYRDLTCGRSVWGRPSYAGSFQLTISPMSRFRKILCPSVLLAALVRRHRVMSSAAARSPPGSSIAIRSNRVNNPRALAGLTIPASHFLD
jgi:hypothetical protein